MEGEALFLVALQTSLVLGLVHGVNPCGHSWLVLAPFVAGQRSGKRVAVLTGSFILGTTFGCLVIGLVLGLLSAQLPDSVRVVTDMAVGVIIILLGAILIWRPHLLHSHDHCHSHDDHDHTHEHVCCGGHNHGHEGHHHGRDNAPKGLVHRKSTVWGLGSIGFVNMIVPCPTAAIMYSYALKSASTFKSVSVFASYAVGTGIALAGVIYLLFKLADWVRRLEKPWVETAIMRVVGALTIGFGVYTLYMDLAA